MEGWRAYKNVGKGAVNGVAGAGYREEESRRSGELDSGANAFKIVSIV